MSRRILLTGGSRGIGRALARALLDRGERVAALGRSSAGLGDLFELKCDLRYPFALDSVIDKAVEWLGGVDVCVLNAAVRRFATVREISDMEWQESLDVNLTAPLVMVRRVIPDLIASRGLVLVMGSQASDYRFETGVAYCATKAALKALAEVLMMELRQSGVRVTTVTPGAVRNRPKENDEWKIEPKDLAEMVCQLIALPKDLFVSEVEIRPTTIPVSEVVGLERMHRI